MTKVSFPPTQSLAHLTIAIASNLAASAKKYCKIIVRNSLRLAERITKSAGGGQRKIGQKALIISVAMLEAARAGASKTTHSVKSLSMIRDRPARWTILSQLIAKAIWERGKKSARAFRKRLTCHQRPNQKRKNWAHRYLVGRTNVATKATSQRRNATV